MSGTLECAWMHVCLALCPLPASLLGSWGATVQRGRKSWSTLHLPLSKEDVSLFSFLPLKTAQEAACFGKLYFSNDTTVLWVPKNHWVHVTHLE